MEKFVQFLYELVVPSALEARLDDEDEIAWEQEKVFLQQERERLGLDTGTSLVEVKKLLERGGRD